MSTTNYPKGRPLKSKGKVVFPITHINDVIDGASKTNPHFMGSIYLNNIAVFSTSGSGGDIKINPLDPKYGGTGKTSLNDLAKAIADALGFDTSGSGGSTVDSVIPIDKGGTGKKTASEALAALGGASVALYSLNVPVSWQNNSAGGYMQTVSLSGIKSTDVPVVGVKLSNDVSAALLQGKAFGSVSRITTATNSITLYCFNSKPTTAFTIQLLTVRGF